MEILKNFIIKSKDFSEIKKKYKKNNRLESIPNNSFSVKCLNGTFRRRKYYIL